MATFDGLPWTLDHLLEVFGSSPVTYRSETTLRLLYDHASAAGFHFYFYLDFRGSLAFSDDGQLSGGTITQIVDFVHFADSNRTNATVSGFVLPVADFLTYAMNNDSA